MNELARAGRLSDGERMKIRGRDLIGLALDIADEYEGSSSPFDVTWDVAQEWAARALKNPQKNPNGARRENDK